MKAPAATKELTIQSMDSLNDVAVRGLAELLMAVVEDGASVGYLSPLDPAHAEHYWNEALQPNVVLLVAWSERRVVGTVQLELATKVNARHRAEVNKLLVHPQFQRRGIASALIRALEDEAAQMGRTLLHLDTREGDGSNDLYLRLGYTRSGRIPHWAESVDGSLDATIFYFKEIERL